MQGDIKELTPQDPLVLRPGDDAWGPFGVSCADHLPSGVLISSVSATAYLYGTEANEIIEEGSCGVSDDTTIQIKFQATENVSAGIYYVDLELQLSNNATKHLAFGPIKVEAW